jgi:hypothetical protein
VAVPSTSNVFKVVSPSTSKFSPILAEPVTPKYFSVTIPTLVTKPSLGEILAIAEPDCILFISPTESADILNNLLPSPSIKDAEIVFVTNTEPVTSVSTFIESLSSVIVALESPSAILLISPTNADVGILVIEFPSP